MQPSPASARAALLRERSELLWSLRCFFREEGFLELEPPMIVRCPGMEPHLDAFEVLSQHSEVGLEGEALTHAQERRWLHTSPEHALKRLLGEGFERVYAIGPCFRDEPPSETHNPEFTMLEWYAKGLDLSGLMAQCERLVQRLAQRALELRPTLNEHLEPLLSEPFERLSVREAFLRYAHVDLERCATLPQLQEASLAVGLSERAVRGASTWDELYFQLYLDLVEPQLGAARPTFLYDFPASQSALARLKPSDPRWALRFELISGGLELANAFDELTDPLEQRARFERELKERAQLGAARYPIDEPLLNALPRLAPCAGIALGFERLLMRLLQQERLAPLLAQPWGSP